MRAGVTSIMDEHWSDTIEPGARAKRVAFDSRSCRVTMRDGARLAVDVHVPRDGTARRPTILRQTRYMRSLAPRGWLAKSLGAPGLFDILAPFRSRFLQAGYAWVDVDVRGTGASDDRWRSPWFEDQRRDAWDLVAWIVDQPWSDGRVGSTGISYDGTCADMLLAEPHPAVRAIAPLFALYDVFADVAFPGGVHLAWFTAAWAAYNRALDRDDHPSAMSVTVRLMARAAACKRDPRGAERLLAALGRLDDERCRAISRRVIGAMVRGVADVEGRGDGTPTAAMRALREHNLDVHAGALEIVHRDDAGIDPERSELGIDSFSPHTYRDAQRASGAAIYSYSGWRDGAYAHSAIKRWGTVPNAGSRLTIGPWAHTGKLAIHAFASAVPSRFDHAGELLDFFDERLRGVPSRGDGQPIHWFSTGEERWHGGSTWPPEGTSDHAIQLSTRALVPEAASKTEIDVLRIDRTVGTGERSRWRSLLGIVPGDYVDRRERDRALLVYDSPALARELEMTGHPTLEIFVSWDQGDDGAVFAYLEDVAPDGRVNYVTEGQLRALHRAVAKAGETGVATPAVQHSFLREDARRVGPNEIVLLVLDLLPCSHVFAAGHRIRLAIAATDTDHFRVPETPARELRVHRGGAASSRLLLPARAVPSFR